MNLFTSAMSLIQSINACESVIIENRSSIFNENTGVYDEEVTSIDAYAQIQTTPSIVQDMSDTATNSVNAYEMWFINLTPAVVDALVSDKILNTRIIIRNNIILDIIEKEDYAYNGWIYVKGVQNGYRK